MEKLKIDEKNHAKCPQCKNDLYYVPGGTVQIVDGKVDFSETQPKYECHNCNTYYQEVMGSGYFEVHPLQNQRKELKNTGDLPPMQLKKDLQGECVCPRCGGIMDFVEGQPVRIVNGVPDMENVKDHFHCSHCESVFRRIASTDYFQWSEK